jgi:hypothetical protein
MIIKVSKFETGIYLESFQIQFWFKTNFHGEGDPRHMCTSFQAKYVQWKPGNTTNHGTDVGWSCYRGGRVNEVENMGVNFMITYSHQKNCVMHLGEKFTSRISWSIRYPRQILCQEAGLDLHQLIGSAIQNGDFMRIHSLMNGFACIRIKTYFLLMFCLITSEHLHLLITI